jgi:hypothetical protein
VHTPIDPYSLSPAVSALMAMAPGVPGGHPVGGTWWHLVPVISLVAMVE